MPKHDDPAFPSVLNNLPCESYNPGMSSVRTWLAGQALTMAADTVAEMTITQIETLLNEKEEYRFETHYFKAIAKLSVRMADALIDELNGGS